MYNVSNSSLMMGNSDDDSQSPSRDWIHELRNRKAGNSNDEVIKGSLHLDSLTEDKMRSLMSVIIEFNPDMKEVVQAFLEVCDHREMEEKLIQLKQKAIMHITDSHVSPSGLQHHPWNCFDVPNPLAHFMKVCVIQGDNLLSERQWEDAVYYVLMAWSHVHNIPPKDTLINWAKQNCFKLLAERCKRALGMMQNSLTNEKCEDLLLRMKVACQQNAAIQPCMDIVGEFLLRWPTISSNQNNGSLCCKQF
ncbi:uncharacterized protein [Montipora capricornis]|uniref:uncharacterized protein n=1 Tax=Montipora capricornis TaxID=246305 RepID=UPI0035F200CE